MAFGKINRLKYKMAEETARYNSISEHMVIPEQSNTVLSWLSGVFRSLWAFIYSSTESINNVGESLMDSAQLDLSNLKRELIKIWDIQANPDRTSAQLIATVLGKIGYTPIIIGVTVISTLTKLAAGAVCMTLGFNLFGCIKKLAEITYNFIYGSINVFLHYVSNLARLIADVARTVAARISTECSRVFSALVRGVNYLLGKIKDICNLFVPCLQAIQRMVTNVCKNLGSSIYHLVSGLFYLGLGVLSFAYIVVKGAILSVAGLFVETGVTTALSGVAKSVFILDESLAAAVGSLMDSIYAFGSSLGSAAKALFGYRGDNYIPEDITFLSDEEDAEQQLLASTPPAAATTQNVTQTADNAYYYHNSMKSGMHYINRGVASVGNGMLNYYNAEKLALLGSYNWSDATEIQVDAPSNNLRPSP